MNTAHSLVKRTFVTFRTEELRKQVIHALEASMRMPTPAQLFSPKYHSNGHVYVGKDGFPDTTNIDWSKIEPSIWLVKDEFHIYCIANARPSINDHRPFQPVFACETDPLEADFHTCHQVASRLLGKQMLWFSIPAKDLIGPVRMKRPTLRLEICHQRPTVFGRIARALASLTGKSDIAATLVLTR